MMNTLSYTQLVPVSAAEHADVRLLPKPDYGFARGASLIPVSLLELYEMAVFCPLLLSREADSWRLNALVGRNGRSVYVGPQGGWNGIHIPNLIRVYPFALALTAETKDPVVCIDMGSSRISRGDTGERLFTPTGEATDGLKEVVELLTKTWRARVALQGGADELMDAGVLKPWSIEDGDITDTAAGDEQAGDNGDNLFCVDGPALHALSGAELHTLVDSGTYRMAVAQLISMRNLVKLDRLESRMRQESTRASNRGGDLADFMSLDDEKLLLE